MRLILAWILTVGIAAAQVRMMVPNLEPTVPTSILNTGAPRCWADFDTDPTTLATWAVKDRQSAAYNYSQSTAGARPTFENGALSFDGGDFITSDNASSGNISASTPWTLAAWINCTTGEHQVIYGNVSAEPPSLLRLTIFLTTAMHIRNSNYNITAWRGVAKPWEPYKNTWTHLVGTYSGAGVNDSANYTIYINGTNAAGSASGSGTLPTAGGNIPLIIGKRNTTGSEAWFTGKIDEPLMFVRCLSADEVWRLYNYSKRGRPKKP